MLSIFYQSIFADLMLDLVNNQRKSAGVGSLSLDANCIIAAKAHTIDQASRLFMGHIGSDGSTVGDRLSAAGFKWDAVAENVAVGQKSVEEVVTAWMNSPGHRENLLNGAYERFGYSQATGSDGQIYWTQDFASAMGGFTPTTVAAPVTPAAPKTPVTPNPVVQFVAPQTSKPADAPKADAPKTDAAPAKADTPAPAKENTPAPAKADTPVPAASPAEQSPSAVPSADSPAISPAAPSTPAPASDSATTDSPTSIVGIAKDAKTPIQMETISSHVPRFIYSLIPAEIQQYTGDINQYCLKIVDYLKQKIPAAIAAAKYFEGHPGLKEDTKYAKTSYAKYDGQSTSSASTLSALVVISLIAYL